MFRWPGYYRVAYNCLKKSSRKATSGPTSTAVESDKLKTDESPDASSTSTRKIHKDVKAKLVSAAFASLRHQEKGVESKGFKTLHEKIEAASTPEDLLALSTSNLLNKTDALKIVSTLTEWSVNGAVKMDQVESDPRFIALCQILARAPNKKTDGLTLSKKRDLSMVLNVTGEDEAAQMVSTLTLPQMIKVFYSLALQKRRSLPLLRTLAFNISKSPIALDIKQAADILYAMASLNFPDEVLLDKASSDLLTCLPNCKKSSVIGSISTSVGILRYLNADLMDAISEWVTNNREICRNQDVLTLLLTLATVNYQPNIADKLFDVLSSVWDKDLFSTISWLDFVWSFAIFQRAGPDHFKSVLTDQFSDKIQASQSNASSHAWKKKLLNINAIAKHYPGYKGPLLNDTSLEIPLNRSKEKQALVSSVQDALSNLFQSSIYLRTNLDLGLGFLLDAECLLNEKMLPQPLMDKKTGEPIVFKKGKGTRVAVMVMDYRDLTIGRTALTGTSVMALRILEMNDYTILPILHSEYNPKDKLADQVEFIESRLKKIVQNND